MEEVREQALLEVEEEVGAKRPLSSLSMSKMKDKITTGVAVEVVTKTTISHLLVLRDLEEDMEEAEAEVEETEVELSLL